jgi:uncharacterized membrane protein
MALGFPRTTAKIIGLRPRQMTVTAIRAVGARELASGVGMFIQPEWGGWPWLRTAGDAMDLALLQTALRSSRVRDDRRLTGAMAAVAAVSALDIAATAPAERRRTHDRGEVGHQARIIAAITINRSPESVYEFWRNFENFPRFMANVESVETIDTRRSRWRAIAPAGMHVDWYAEIVEDRPNELISWRSTDHADVSSAGAVSFRPAPGGRGTEARVEMSYDPPAGKVGRAVSKIFWKEPGQEIRGDLRRLKSVLEAGEVIRSDATLGGRAIPQRAAQPPVDIRDYSGVKS